ncbi:aminotransferase class I/II-fold pyridoxal phosphate-dependent enzyme [Streptomyces sp. SID7982]|nr:aminotransferase class I/II-fold pyridoxal phosphate-dependent enzyme [Streptomyces sp. SID7982]
MKVVNFAAGELDLEPPPVLRETLAAAARNRGAHRYTDTAGLPELREALADRISRLSGVAYEPGEVMVTAGAKHALHLAFLALVDPGDEVLVPRPGWGTFAEQVRLAGGVPVPVATWDTGFVPTVRKLEERRTGRTRAVVLNTPGNPTGAVCPPETIAEIVRWAVRHRVWIIFDESYGELVEPGTDHCHPVALLPEARELTVGIGSFSKSFAVTGWRVGHVHAPASLVAVLKNMQSQTSSNATSVVQHAVLPAARGEVDGFVSDVRGILASRRSRVAAALTGLPGVSFDMPQGAFYFFLDVRALLGRGLGGAVVDNTEGLAELLLRRAGTALTPGTAFGAEGYLRLSYAIDASMIDEGLASLKKVLDDVL